jgi:hypothetical protein
MKRKATKKDPENKPAAQPSEQRDEELSKELSDATSIEEFIKSRKLQNMILEKMLIKITDPESKENKTKRNK